MLCLAFIGAILADYGLHLLILHSKKKKPLLIVSIVLNVGLLAFCKLSGTMPVGVSFFVFQAVSLLIDSRDEKISLIDFAAFLCFFPRILMGPLVRFGDYRKILKESSVKSLMTFSGLEEGLKLFTVGLGLKVIIADRLASLWNSICVSGALGITTAVAWLGAITFSLELYFDFSGYSLMAMGLGKMLGFPVPENFNEPYSSKSVSEFWRRWHISLGAWFRDYIYIPLGGSRKGTWRTILNLFIVWLLTGIWHGITLNFIIWGAVLFVLIVLEKVTLLGKLCSKKVFGHIYLLVLIPVTWMIFSITDLGELWTYLKCMFGIISEEAYPAAGQFLRYMRTYAPFIGTGLLFATPLPRKLYVKFGDRKWFIIPLALIFGYSVYLIMQGAGNVFLYLNF